MGDPRFEDNHICLKLHLKCNINWNSGVFLAGVEAPSSLLLALLPLPPAAGRHTQEAAEPGGRRRRRLEESGVETKHNPITIYSLGNITALWKGYLTIKHSKRSAYNICRCLYY